MACYSPLTAWRPDQGGPLLWKESPNSREIEIACGQCVGCRLERSRQWAVRCIHEAQMHEVSSFITLTYDNDHVPKDSSLRYSDFQEFMRSLRDRLRYASSKQKLASVPKSTKTSGAGETALSFSRVRSSAVPPRNLGVRYFVAGEYGDNTSRPHYHALLFGVGFPDRELYRSMPSGSKLYTSKWLADLWPKGFSSVGDVTFESAAYVARYVLKKITGARADEHYKCFDPDTGEVFWREPEFCHMSLKPAIGATWFEKFGRASCERDYVVVRGIKMRPPKYYDKLFDTVDGFSAEYRDFLRAERGLKRSADNTASRLRVREECAKARLAFKKRTLK